MKKNDFKNYSLTSVNILVQDMFKTIQAKTAYDTGQKKLEDIRALLTKINHNNENVDYGTLKEDDKTFYGTYDKEKKRRVYLESRTESEKRTLAKQEKIQKLLKNDYIKDLIEETAFKLNERNIVFYKTFYYLIYKISNLKINTETNLFEDNKVELSIKELIDNKIFTKNYKQSAGSFFEFHDKMDRIKVSGYYYNKEDETISYKNMRPFGISEYVISLRENADKIIFYIPNEKNINLVDMFKNKIPYCSWQNEIRTNLTFKIHILIQSLAIQRIEDIKTDGYFTIKLLNIASLINFETDLNSLKITKETSKEEKTKIKKLICKRKTKIMNAIKELQTYSKNDYEIEVNEDKKTLYVDFIKYLEETKIKIKPINEYLKFFKNFKYTNNTKQIVEENEKK